MHYLINCIISTNYTVDKNENVVGVGNGSVGGTQGVTGNTTLNGSLTQSVGRNMKFSGDISGNTSVGGTLIASPEVAPF